MQLFYSPATFTSNTCVSLPNRTSYIWSCAFRKPLLHPVLSIWCRYFVDILKLAPPYTQTHSHQLIPYSLKGKKKGNITTSCVSAWKFDSHVHISHEAWNRQASLTVPHSLTLLSFRKSVTTSEKWGWMMWKGMQQWISAGGRSNRVSFLPPLEASGRDGEENRKSTNTFFFSLISHWVFTPNCSSNDTLFSVCTASPRLE